MLSLTSSASDSQIIAAAPFIDKQHPLRPQFELILKYVGLLAKLSDNDDDGGNDSDNFDNDFGSDANSNSSVLSINDEMVQRLVHPEQYSDSG